MIQASLMISVLRAKEVIGDLSADRPCRPIEKIASRHASCRGLGIVFHDADTDRKTSFNSNEH